MVWVCLQLRHKADPSFSLCKDNCCSDWKLIIPYYVIFTWFSVLKQISSHILVSVLREKLLLFRECNDKKIYIIAFFQGILSLNLPSHGDLKLDLICAFWSLWYYFCPIQMDRFINVFILGTIWWVLICRGVNHSFLRAICWSLLIKYKVFYEVNKLISEFWKIF